MNNKYAKTGNKRCSTKLKKTRVVARSQKNFGETFFCPLFVCDILLQPIKGDSRPKEPRI